MRTRTDLSLEQRVLEIARDRGTIDEEQPTASQHFEVLMSHFETAKKRGAEYCADPTSGREILLINAMGQCLFDLIVQTEKQGVSLEDCIPSRKPFAVIAPVWPLVDAHLNAMRQAVNGNPKGHQGTITAIAQVHACLCAGTRAYLRNTPESCLELVLGQMQ